MKLESQLFLFNASVVDGYKTYFFVLYKIIRSNKILISLSFFIYSL